MTTRMKTNPKLSQFVTMQVWRKTKIKLVRSAKKRGEKLAKYVDDLSNI